MAEIIGRRGCNLGHSKMSIKQVLTSFLAFFLINYVFASFSAFADDSVKKPKAQIDGAAFDFGTVTEGTVVTHTFSVKNVGTADLTIQKVVAGCGCTATSASTVPIPSGQSGTVDVSFDSSGFSGDKVKEVRVFTNDPDAPTSVVSIKGYIDTVATVDPPRVALGDVQRGSLQSVGRDVTVEIKAGSESKILEAKSFSKNLMVTDLGGGDKKRKVHIGLSDSAPNGELRERVIVSISDKAGQTQAMNIPVVGSIRGAVLIKPSTLSFGVIEGKAPMQKSFKLENAASEAIRIKNVMSDSDAVSTSVETITAGKEYIIHVTLDPTKVRDDLKATIQIATTSRDQEMVSVNVYGVLPPKA